jgi:nucleoside 2-deoxyribosyltransferase
MHKAEGLVLVSNSRGKDAGIGCHFEAGYMYAHRCPVFVYGPITTCFYDLCDQYEDVDDLFAGIAGYHETMEAQQSEEAEALARLRLEQATRANESLKRTSRYRMGGPE